MASQSSRSHRSPASRSRGGLSSAFDEMLQGNRSRLNQQWDDLLQGARTSAPPTAPAASPAPSAHAAAALPEFAPAATSGRSPLKRSGEYASASRVWDAARSVSAQALSARWGEDWEFEVASVSREPGEFVVLGRLAIPSRGIVRSQFGRGAIPGSARQATGGSAGGVRFRVGSGGGGAGQEAGGGGQTPEDRGYRRAIEDALTRCLAML